MEKYYTLNEIALITGFTTRTLRTYIKDGLLNGSKVKNKWLFTEENLNEFFSQSFIAEGLKIKNNIIVKDFVEDIKKNAPKACFIYDLPGEHSEILDICTKLTDLLKENNISNFQFRFHYDDKAHMARFIFTCDLSKTKDVMDMIYGSL